MLVGSAACALHGIDFLFSPSPGGYVGAKLYMLMHQSFDYIGAGLCIYMLMYASFIIVMRFSYMGFVHASWRWSQQVTLFVYERRLVQRTCFGIYELGKYAISPVIKLVYFLKQLFTGTLFFGYRIDGAR